ncbi:MAG: YafY family protein [Chloroflexota bacterium]
MRADRLLSMMLMLQTRGKMTASDLAEALEVSRRTILRDVDALSTAGVPVYAEGGHGGGIALDEHYRTQLTGLHEPELRALLIADNRAILRDVGLENAAEQVVLKLLGALSSKQRDTAHFIQQRLLIDPTWWWHDTAESSAFWEDLQTAVYENRRIHVSYENYTGNINDRLLEPYSLVNKSGHWYVVALRDDDFRTYRVARFKSVTLQNEHFERHPDFDLPAYWQSHVQRFANQVEGYSIIVRIAPEQATFVQWLAPGRWTTVESADERGWVTLRIVLESMRLAKMLVLELGNQAEIIEPPELVHQALQDAHAFIAQYESTDE